MGRGRPASRDRRGAAEARLMRKGGIFVRSPLRRLLIALALWSAFVACSGPPSMTATIPASHDAAGRLGAHPNVSFVLGPYTAIGYGPWIRDRFPDEHTSFLKYPDGSFRIWSGVASGYTYVYTSTDLSHFVLPTTEPVFGHWLQQNNSFDAAYAGAGQVVQDPRTPKVLYMLYEGDTTCYGTPHVCGNSNYYWATVGIAHAYDPNETGYPNTWTGFRNDENQAHRTAALVSPDAMPTALPPQGYYGNGIPSGFVDPLDPAHTYLYAYYEYHPYPQVNSNQSRIEVARDAFSDLQAGAPAFKKFFHGSFSNSFNQPGERVVPVDSSRNCVSQERPSVTYNTVLAEYLMILVCTPNGGTGIPMWYYTTTTNIDAQAWATPVPLATFSTGLPWYPSFVSPDQQDGNTTDASGFIFFQWGYYAPYETTFSIAPSGETLGSLFAPSVAVDPRPALLGARASRSDSFEL
jgi:hypothetical protein